MVDVKRTDALAYRDTIRGGNLDAQAYRELATRFGALHHRWSMRAGNLLAVSHGGMPNAVLNELTGASRARFAFGNTGFARLYPPRGSHTGRLLSINEQPHQPPRARQ